MIEYIKKLCNSFIASTNSKDSKYENISTFEWPRLIYSEISNLKTMDFDPGQRYDFVLVRQKFSQLAHMSRFDGRDLPKFAQLAKKLIDILDGYFYNSSSSLQTRDFSFIRDNDLKRVIERDYNELETKLMPDGAWKSVVILSGSILEAILHDALTTESIIGHTNTSTRAPRKNGNIIPIESGKWKLVNLIEVAVDLSILPSQRAASIDQVLRDYRNFVHPQKEIRSAHPCTEAEAYMSKGCLDGVYNHLIRPRS